MLTLVIQRSNIIHTITTPSESLLKELQTVEVRSMMPINLYNYGFKMQILAACY
jgi:hypothetical protein